MKKTTKNWLEMSEYDFETAVSLLKTKRFVYVIFLCHLCIEKMIKSIISEKKNITPPYSHNLKLLTKLADVDFPTELLIFVEEINLKSVPTRYPEDLNKINKEIGQKAAELYLKNTRKVMKWLKQELVK